MITHTRETARLPHCLGVTVSQLSNVINDALDRNGLSGMSSRDLAARTGDAISKDSIVRYRRGDHGMPSEAVLVALAELTNTPVGDLRRAAGVAEDGGGEWMPPAEAVRLTRRQRQALDELIRSMVAVTPDRIDAEWLLAHPDRDPVLQEQLADVRNVRRMSARQRDKLETTQRGAGRPATAPDSNAAPA